MEEYTNNNHLSENTAPSPSPRPNFLYSPPSGGNHSHSHNHHQFPINTFHLQSGGSDHCFQSDQVAPHPSVKTEASTSQLHAPIFHYPLMRGTLHNNTTTTMHHHPHQQGGSPTTSTTEVEAIKAKIIAHPQYSNLLEAYMDCQKVTYSLINYYYSLTTLITVMTMPPFHINNHVCSNSYLSPSFSLFSDRSST